MSSTLIVYFLTIGALLPPIVIFSFFAECNFFFFLHSSNHGFSLLRFAVFCFSILRFLPFCFFAFVIMRLPKTNSLQVACKLADKTKHKIMTEVLRVFAGLDVKAVQFASVARVTFASPEKFRAAKSFSGKHLFGLWRCILGGGPPITRVHVFDFPFEEDDRSSEIAFEAYCAVKSVYQACRCCLIWGVNPLSDGGQVFVSFVVSWSTPCLQSLCRSGPQIGKLP